MIYLDNAATTLQKPATVFQRVNAALKSCANPGRGGHPAAMHAAEVIYAARERAAALFDAEPEQVVFTTNATHGLNIAIRTLLHPGDRVVVSGFEHNAVMRPLHAIGTQTVIASTALFSPEQTLDGFSAAMTNNTKAVIVNHVSNVFGYVQPLEQIAELCRRRGIPLIVDASQSAGVLPVHCKALDAAFIAMPGHKGLYGPQGTGLLLCGRLPEPLLYGGTGSLSAQPEMPDFLPDRVEAGTLNVHGIAGLLGGLEFVSRQGTAAIACHEEGLRRKLCRGLARLDGVCVFDGGTAQTGVVSFQAENMDCETLAQRLSERQIAVRAGLHCAPQAHRSAGTFAQGTVRASVCAFTTPQQVSMFLYYTQDILKKQRRED